MYYSLIGIPLIIILDQWSKYWAVTHCTMPNDILPFVTCHLVFNRGTTWSLFATDNVYYYALLCSIIALILIIAAWYLLRQRDWQVQLASIGIIGGGLSNLIDRLLYPGVADFIDLHSGQYHWPTTFNIADCAITIGIIALLWRELRA
ncbi:signal peptidase II [Candidatus Dependentiae bacterium]|nr:signal peptidase II [Candidatus Dependentiae bacterium]